MNTRIQLRRDIAENWTDANPTLAQGEIGIELDTNKIKIGDGATAWNSLAYFGAGGFPNPFALTSILTPDALTGDVDDYNPTGLSSADVLRLDTDGGSIPYSITGIAGGTDGRVLIIQNITSGRNLVLVNESSSSTEANRMLMNGNITIRPSRIAVLIYDATVSRWRLLASGNADSLQGVPVAAGLSGVIQNNDLLIYNAGDKVLEPVSPHELSPLLFNDSEGVPSPIGTASNGTSDYPARRDHSHAGGDGGGEAFPVGSVFISVVSTDPATLVGYGTWEEFGKGRMLVGFDEEDEDFDTVEATGGEKAHTLTTSEMPSHTHTQNPHTHTQNPHTHTQNAHNHTQSGHNHNVWSGDKYITGLVGTGGSGSAPSSSGSFSGLKTGTATPSIGNTTATNQNTTATNQNTTATNQNTGGGQAHNNMPPYVVVYMWKRTS